MMDWSAKLLGLSPAFFNESGIGGGVMMVRVLLSQSLALHNQRLHRPARRTHPLRLSPLHVHVTSATFRKPQHPPSTSVPSTQLTLAPIPTQTVAHNKLSPCP